MVSEITKMQEFHHPHVMSLIGVCLDAGPGVSMVMPYMTNGSLLDYLKKERCDLELAEGEDSEKVFWTLCQFRLIISYFDYKEQLLYSEACMLLWLHYTVAPLLTDTPE